MQTQMFAFLVTAQLGNAFQELGDALRRPMVAIAHQSSDQREGGQMID
jgi:hypothetical protein